MKIKILSDEPPHLGFVIATQNKKYRINVYQHYPEDNPNGLFYIVAHDLTGIVWRVLSFVIAGAFENEDSAIEAWNRGFDVPLEQMPDEGKQVIQSLLNSGKAEKLTD